MALSIGDILNKVLNTSLFRIKVDATNPDGSNIGGTGGASHTDDVAFTPATDDGTVAFAFADETAPDSVDEGDAGALRMTLARLLKVQVSPGTPKLLVKDETLADADKIITVTAGKTWLVTSIYVAFTSTATVGNRRIQIQFRDSASTLINLWGGGFVTQPASLTRWHSFTSGTGGPREQVFSTNNGDYVESLPTPFYWTDTEDMRFIDANGIDPVADDMKIYIYGVEITE